MPTIVNKSSKYALWFSSLLLVACAGGSEPQSGPAPIGAQEQAQKRIPCKVTADCAVRGGICSEGLCRAENECATAADCSDGSQCVPDVNFGGLCATTEDPTPVPNPTMPCDKNGLCPAGQFCDADGMCRGVHACHSDKDCRKGQVCDVVTGRCVPRPPPPHDCRSDADCPAGQICDPATEHCVARPCDPNPDGTCK
jgi:Cys-rich repeat protein